MIKVQIKEIADNTDQPILNYCRALIKAKKDPEMVLEVYDGPLLLMKVNGIGMGAKLAIDQDATKFKLYRPLPDSLKTR